MWLAETLIVIVSSMAGEYLRDATDAYHVRFRHDTGAEGSYLFPEITGSGAGLVDLNGDGFPEGYLVQSGPLGREPAAGAKGPAVDLLLLNDRGKAFTGEPVESALGYGMGVAAGDVNNDGLPDLLLTNFGGNQLLLNDGRGGLEDSTSFAGISGDHWSTSATFFDMDRDGWLDLFITNYVDFPVGRNPECFSASGRRDYCGPNVFPAVRDQLYRNLGNGQFQDVTLAMLGDHKAGAGLGVVAADFNSDGWPDLFVANDGAHNHLWINNEGKGFSNEALYAGVAVNGRGVAEASMGVAVADFDEDGDEDLFLTHLMGETNTYYRNLGNLEFEDATQKAGLAAASRGYTAWATAPVDINQDGWLDLVVLNGAVSILEDQHARGAAYPYGQPNQVFLNQRGEKFLEVPAQELPSTFLVPLSSRGGAFGDVNGDGSVDVLVNNGHAQAQLFVGASPEGNWLGVTPMLAGNRVAIGAWLELALNDGTVKHRRIRRGGSYASANDPRAVFHLGNRTVSQVAVTWPDGSVTRHQAVRLNRYIEVRKPS